MNDKDIVAGLTEIFCEVFGDDRIVLRSDMTAKDIVGWDSFNHLNIIVATESRFGFSAQTTEIENLQNVGDLVALISRKTSR
jgi:acyl carrier protein